MVMNRYESADSSEKKKKRNSNKSFEVDYLEETEDASTEKQAKKITPSKFKITEV
jgi:hypothetical protein